MYLKSFELIGFKSFADRTVLEFGPGISAIVGPNGCGKSNISDAIRWVLGEQSARLLRGSKMEDCIFGGTDIRKPLGMAEVSLSLTECEKTLGTEFHDITVTRRVFRSGEGQYFINKVPCRLKDIQRLFMDTGIGTNSYSLMEQGRVDLILRSRPEDRREVFEEASGITKYKSDKREALRKLEQTEANLTRLADIIKEVKRQIISLQRQAGKAARYKKLHEELRGLDIFVARDKLGAFDRELQALEAQIASLNEKIEAREKDIADFEAQCESMQAALARDEQTTAAAQQAQMELNSQVQQSRQFLQTGRQRLKELAALVRNETADIASATRELENNHREIEQTRQRLKDAQPAFAEAEKDLKAKSQKQTDHERRIENLKQTINACLAESLELENREVKLNHELQKLENEDRNIVSRRERCAADQSNQRALLESHTKRLAGITEVLARLRAEANQTAAELERMTNEQQGLAARLKAQADQRAEMRAQLSGVEARLDLLTRDLTEKKGFSDGARQLLGRDRSLKIDPNRILGALAEQIETKPEFRLALEAVLRAWLDAVVVSDMAAAIECLRELEGRSKEPLRLLVADLPGDTPAPIPAPEQGIPLITHVAYPKPLAGLINRILGNVWLVDALVSAPDPRGVYVTRAGALVRGDGFLELFRPGVQAGNPLGQKHLIQELHASQSELKARLEKAEADRIAQERQIAEGEQASRQIRERLDEQRMALGQEEGEHRIVSRQTDQVRENLETVTWELRELEKQAGSAEAKSAMIAEIDATRSRRSEIKVNLTNHHQALTSFEQDNKRLNQELLAANTCFIRHKETLDHLTAQHQPLADRIARQEEVIREHSGRRDNYQSESDSLQQSLVETEKRLPQLEETARQNSARLLETAKRREQKQDEIKTMAERLKGLRNETNEHRNRKSGLNEQCVAMRLNRQHLIERITGEYRIAPDAIQTEPEPQWGEEGRPAPETLDGRIAEMRAKLEAMGPVNYDAIQEYQQLEERYTFLNQQQEDLLKSKAQLMEMIRKINQTTTQMFEQTFALINDNFQSMFQTLFGGGTAKLILTDDEDILECGIEIFARPPGKRLQSISLLSGGESTLTAVALLFAIYMVKPSPFCVLDEMDAALDESNIQRFIKVLKGFLNQSQFIVITHNRQTIAVADVLYGVTMAEDKISKIVSMKFNAQRGKPAETPDALAPGIESPSPQAESVPEIEPSTTQATPEQSAAGTVTAGTEPGNSA